METDVGYYVANGVSDYTQSGIVISNCRCTSRWVDADEWADLQKQGKHVESSW